MTRGSVAVAPALEPAASSPGRIGGWVLVVAACLHVGACGPVEERRIGQQVEIDLGIVLTSRPSLAMTESYGWAEEGGDRALLRLGGEDCSRVAVLLGQPEAANTSSEYFRMFVARGIRPTHVAERFLRDESGDHRHYVLDARSCALYREAHFE